MIKSKFKVTAAQIQALRQGDKAIFQNIFKEYQPRLYRFLWIKLRSIEVAEDLVQETFLRFWQARERLKTDSNLEIYLFRIASNWSKSFSSRPGKRKLSEFSCSQ